MYSTKHLAREVVEGLKSELSGCYRSELRNIYSVCISGSYARGDFLDCNSDLDINVILKPGSGSQDINDPGYPLVRSVVNNIIGGRPFPSHTPGGIDWNPLLWEWLPTAEVGPIFPHDGPYFSSFGVFLFDLHQHLEVCWGEDPRPILASPPDPASMAQAWFRSALVKIDRLSETRDRRRAAFGAFKSLQLAQVIFGELTLHKIRLADLYRQNVPDFPMESIGEQVIQSYISSKYPESPPEFAEIDHYRRLTTELWHMIRKRQASISF